MIVYSIFVNNSEVENYFDETLPDFITDRIKNKTPKDRANSKIGYKLLKEILIKYFNKNTDVLNEISYTEFRKPVLDGISFNISHSECYTACVVSENLVVGIDIEVIKKVDLADFEITFSNAEETKYKENQYDLNEFYKNWTIKESYSKAIGLGLHLDFKNIDILKNECKSNGYEVFYFKNYLNTAFSLTICCNKSEPEVIRFDHFL